MALTDFGDTGEIVDVHASAGVTSSVGVSLFCFVYCCRAALCIGDVRLQAYFSETTLPCQWNLHVSVS